MPTFYELSSAQLRKALQLREQIETLQQKLNAILGSPAPSSSDATEKTKRATGKTKGRRAMSAEARAKIAAAATARWAKIKRSKPASKGAPSTPKKKSGLTTEGRAKLAASMKARWAARKKGGVAPNAPTS